MNWQETKIIATLGPATKSESDLRKIKSKGVDFVRINMSHSSIDDLNYFIILAKKIDLPFIIDTEGSQIRTGYLNKAPVELEENQVVKLYQEKLNENGQCLSLRPDDIIDQLEEGDLIYIDFDAMILRVSDISSAKLGYITARVLTSGSWNQNKAVAIDSASRKTYQLPVLTGKDYQSIKIGLQEGVKYIAASFMRSGESVEEVRQATQGKMQIISKIECHDALKNLPEIINKSDFLLIDRGDLSKEIPLDKIPLIQKMIISQASQNTKGVFVATNLLESMVSKRKPTRAECHDVVSTILDGASGVVLSSETAIGKYPMESINMINKLIKQTELVDNPDEFKKVNKHLNEVLQKRNYLLDNEISSGLISPHGGRLINRCLTEIPSQDYLNKLLSIKLDQNSQMDAEQIAIGTFSPLEGFLEEKDFQSVLERMRLASGIIWTIPIILDVSESQAKSIKIGDEVSLVGDDGVMAILHVSDKYGFDKKETCQKLYGTDSDDHPGVRWIKSLRPVLLGGKIDLIKRRKSEFKEYELTPSQVRRIFEERGWSRVVGFHTRNVIHLSHEFIQLKALNDESCDGLFVHPVIGKKKPGDYNTFFIVKSYQEMMDRFYPKDKVVLATFSTFSRYAGPREAIFTALCRKNFGCSHFVVGRDHTGVGNFYHPRASHEIFDRFPDLGIKAVKFDQVFFSKKLNRHVHEADCSDHQEDDKLHISGTEARKMFENNQKPPEWFMRPEIADLILCAMKAGEEVFVGLEKKLGRIIWFTGLSGSGKTTIALELKKAMESEGKSVEIIDGDVIRTNEHKHLGFSREDIRKNNRLIAELALEKAGSADFVLIPVISPYREDRVLARTIVGSNFIELFVNLPLAECQKRDVKGLYQKAREGKLDNLIGFHSSSPYEPPVCPDLEVRTDIMNLTETVEKIIQYLNQLR